MFCLPFLSKDDMSEMMQCIHMRWCPCFKIERTQAHFSTAEPEVGARIAHQLKLLFPAEQQIVSGTRNHCLAVGDCHEFDRCFQGRSQTSLHALSQLSQECAANRARADKSNSDVQHFRWYPEQPDLVWFGMFWLGLIPMI